MFKDIKYLSPSNINVLQKNIVILFIRDQFISGIAA